MSHSVIAHAARVLRQGGIVAYPTESCYGLGCDPQDRKAVLKLLRLKRRSMDKGLILIAANLRQLQDYISEPPPEYVLESWPGPVTWLLPPTPHAPRWITGKHQRIALRVTAHRMAAALCRRSAMALVSTSANRTGQRAARSEREVQRRFGTHIDYILPGNIGTRWRPSAIMDAADASVIRAG